MSDNAQHHTSPKNFTDAVSHLDEMTSQKARAWVDEGRRIWVLSVVAMMLSSFISVYFFQNKRKLGVRGLFLATSALMQPFLIYAKYWEYKRSERSAHS